MKGKALYTTCGAASEYGRVGCNFYKGCSNGCTYCYLKRGAPSKELGGSMPELKKCFKDEGHALEVFCAEMHKHIDTLRETGVFFSFTTDPMLLKTRDLTISALYALMYNHVPAIVLTKNTGWVEYYRVRNKFASFLKHDVRFGFTLTGRDDIETGSSTNEERIKAMGRLKWWGIKTWASIEPVVDWESAYRMVEDSIHFCDHYKIGLMSGVKKSYYDDKEIYERISEMVDFINSHGKTVYLKHSIRKRLAECDFLTIYQYERLMAKTVASGGLTWV